MVGNMFCIVLVWISSKGHLSLIGPVLLYRRKRMLFGSGTLKALFSHATKMKLLSFRLY
jgi:hypothetical protein